MRPPPGSLLNFLIAHIHTPHADTDPCVEWPAGWSTSRGYGTMRYLGRTRNAHAVLLELRDGPAPEGRPFACHGPCNNSRCIVHTYWGSPAENMRDRVRDGTVNRGERQGSARLTPTEVHAIRNLIAEGVSQREIAKRYGVAQMTVSDIATFKQWGWL